MRKGPVPEKAIELVLPVARARGFVIRCARNGESGIDLVIAAPGLTAFVCVCRTRRLYESPDDLAVQFAIPVTMLRRMLPCPGRSCEIWACDYYGNIRCFRLTGTGKPCLSEIGRDGNPVTAVTAARLSEDRSGRLQPVVRQENVPA